MKIYKKKYNIGNDLNKKVVLISDIHYFNKKEISHLYKVLDEIKKINPDFICIPGDTIDKSKIYDEDLLINWLKDLSKKFKTIITLGNHEYYINRKKGVFGLNKEFINKIKSINNIYFLDNENILIDNINFIGINPTLEDYFEKRISIDINKYVDKKHYNIMLCHTPINIESKVFDSNINLVLSGHMHGGLVPRLLRPIFKNRGLINPDKTLFPKYSYGLKKVSNTNIVVTSGVRLISHENKFYFLTKFFSSEIAIISI